MYKNSIEVDELKSDEFKKLKKEKEDLYPTTFNFDAVKGVQSFLNEEGYTDQKGEKLFVDGRYGANTANAVMDYQKANGLSVDGIVGDETWDSIYRKKKKKEDEADKSSAENWWEKKGKKIPDVWKTPQIENLPHITGSEQETRGKNEPENKIKPWGPYVPGTKWEPWGIYKPDGEKESRNTKYGNSKMGLNNPGLKNEGKKPLKTSDYTRTFEVKEGPVQSYVNSIVTKTEKDSVKGKENYNKWALDTVDEYIEEKYEKIKEYAHEIVTDNKVKTVEKFVGQYGFNEDEVRGFVNNPDQRNIVKTDYRVNYDFSVTSAKDVLSEELLSAREEAVQNVDKAAEYIAIQAIADVKKFDDESITTAYYLNDFNGANFMGHAGVLLVNNKGESVLFSFYPHDEKDLKDSDSEMRVSIFNPRETTTFLENKLNYAVSTSGNYRTEQYENVLRYSVSPQNGKAMFEQAVAITAMDDFKYNLLEQNCDHVALSILNCGGLDILKSYIPNITYGTELIK